MEKDIGDQILSMKTVMKTYDYIIVGAGIAGCSTAYFLSKYSKNILLIDRNIDVAIGASGAAGAFLSPLLGKPNKFKDLVTKSLKFSTKFYLDEISSDIKNCGVVRIPKNKEDEKKFQSYIPFMDFEYEKKDGGYFFPIGSQVNSYNICKFLSKDVKKLRAYEINDIRKEGDIWILNDEIFCKNLILTSGADTKLIDEEYFKLRAVWGQKIDVLTSTKTTVNYHKTCSLSNSTFCEEKQKNLVSIGATHNRVDVALDDKNQEYLALNLVSEDTKKLLDLANDIKVLEDVEVLDIKLGARAASMDYFPMVGKLVNSQETLKKHPHFIHGTFVKDENLSFYDNLFVLNGLGGRGFVLAPYLAKQLVEFIVNNKDLDDDIKTNRLFKRWVKKQEVK